MKLLKDICCGRGGASKGFIAAGWRAKGYDITPQPDYPGRFILRDVLKMKASDLREADFVWASTPCQQFSVHTMPHFHPNPPFPEVGIRLFEHVRNICEASGRPFVLENVRGAEKFVGPAVNHCGPFYLWGNAVPAIMPANLFKLKKGFCGMTGAIYRKVVAGKLNREQMRTLRRGDPSAAVAAEIPIELSLYLARTRS